MQRRDAQQSVHFDKSLNQWLIETARIRDCSKSDVIRGAMMALRELIDDGEDVTRFGLGAPDLASTEAALVERINAAEAALTSEPLAHRRREKAANLEGGHAVPIRPENRALYPKNWKAIALAVKQEMAWTCEECGLRHGEPNRVSGAKVVLTVSHSDHDPRNCARSNLKALCDTCHTDLMKW